MQLPSLFDFLPYCSLLIYNLPETIRESDVAKLSFAVELAQGLYQSGEGQVPGWDNGQDILIITLLPLV